ncbi:spore germination protein KC [Thalassobacillus devorans]|uniref:Spore germination protein KC n=1 Tax=Thalassobacillus devorans TaxID=279813 RepID=A0ABQ1NDQ8_9BACI|nr:Ger(x)C family spore germination protein [Thalassobacillus devorans]NIK26919.1 spore germination protein KC [Thalassobacillus devorans]GGC73459.1 spore germination protein KC [Thalassobacillus devorans]
MTNNFSFLPISKRLSITLACLLFLTGCWNSRELDELGIAVALGIDKTEEGNYLLVVQMINPSEIATEAPSTRPPVSLYQSEGETIFEALRKMTLNAPRKIYMSQLRLLVIGPGLAEEGILPTLDLLYRDPEFRTSFLVTVAKDVEVEDLLSVITAYEKIPANKIMDSIIAAESHWAATHGIYIDQIVSDIRSPGKSPVLTGILLEGSEEAGNNVSNVENVDSPARIHVDHLSVFKGDRMLGWLNEDESKGYNYIVGNVKSTLINFPCEEKESGKIGVEILRTNAAIDATKTGSKPSITVTVEAEGNVGEIQCDLDLTKPDTLKKIADKAETDIKQKLTAAITAAKEQYQTDIFGFGNALSRKEPVYWKRVEKDWDEHFVDMDVKVEVKLEIRRKGTIVQPVQKKG